MKSSNDAYNEHMDEAQSRFELENTVFVPCFAVRVRTRDSTAQSERTGKNRIRCLSPLIVIDYL